MFSDSINILNFKNVFECFQFRNMCCKICEVSEHLIEKLFQLFKPFFQMTLQARPSRKNDAEHETKASFLPRSGRVRPGSFAGSAARPAAPPATRQARRTPKRPLHPLSGRSQPPPSSVPLHNFREPVLQQRPARKPTKAIPTPMLASRC